MSVLWVGACAPTATMRVSGSEAKGNSQAESARDSSQPVDAQIPTALDENTTGSNDPEAHDSDPITEETVPVIERDPDVDFTTIGCVLPMSGRSRLVGETVLKGVMLGAQALAIEDGMNLTVVVRDSKSNPEEAARVVEQLVTKERVAAIVGPMDGLAAQAAAQKADELGVPLLLFSIRDGLARGKEHAFRQFATNRSEVSALAQAAARLGNTKIAVLFPNSGYGRTMGELMKQEASLAGLEFVGAFPFDPKSQSFVEASSNLAKVDFDTLFIPDAAARIALLAPALASAGLWATPSGMEPEGPGRAMQLLIPSAGLALDLPRRAGRYLSGALFSSFLSGESSPRSANFIEQFELEYGARPNFLSGYGHDAVVLVAAAVRSGALNRDEISDWIKAAGADSTKILPLAMPFAGFSSEGEPLAQPWILQLIGNEFVALR